MDTKKRVIVFFSFLLVFAALLMIAQIGMFGSLTGFIVFSQSNESDFSFGAYRNIVWNGSAIVLSGGNLSGNYTSEVVDAGQLAIWNNISLVRMISEREDLFAVDSDADVWVSDDLGVTWHLQKNDYTGGDANNANDMYVNSSGSLFVLFNQDVWKSDNYGVSWTKINDDYNMAESQSGSVMAIDRNDDLYVIENDEDVWKSTDSGLNWTKINDDYDEGTSASNPIGFVVNDSNGMFIVDGNSDIWMSSNLGLNWTKINDDYNGGISNGANDMFINSSDNLYIVDGQDVWTSTNSGVSWNLVNDDFNVGDSGNAFVLYADGSDNIFIVDGSQDIYNSSDSGVSFTLLSSNFNGGNDNVFGFSSIVLKSNLTYQVRNCSSPDCSDGIFRGPDGTGNSYYQSQKNDLNLNSRYFQYRIFFEKENVSLLSYLSSVEIDYDFAASAPVVNINSPSEGSTLGFNESIPLKYLVSNTSALSSCWFTSNGGIMNNTISGCLNTTFNVSGNGNYVISVYANESVSGLVGNDNVSFSVQLGSPSISLVSPANNFYSDISNVTFLYNASDIDLDSCQLFGDFTGSFSSNQTDSEIISGVQNSFALNLSDGNYLWNVFCNDTLGNGAINGNRTLNVDTRDPDVNLTAPTGTYNSRNDVPLVFSVGDQNSVSCIYWINRGLTVEVSNTSINCSSGSEEFDVTVDADFSLNFYANDSAGNSVLKNSDFSVSTSSGSGSGGGGGGGGGRRSRSKSAETTAELIEEMKISFGLLDEIELRAGETEIISLEVINSGTRFLNECRLRIEGKMSEWASSRQIESLSSGQIVDFVFNLNVPENSVPGFYSSFVIIECSELRNSVSLKVNVVASSFGVLIKNTEKIGNKLRVDYLLEDLSGISQNVIINYALENIDGLRILEGEESVFLEANSRLDEVLEFELPKGSTGDFIVVFDVSNGIENSVVNQKVNLSLTGFAIAGISDANKRIIFSIGFWAIMLFTLYSVVRFLRSHHLRTTTGKRDRHLIKVDLEEWKEKKGNGKNSLKK